MGATSAGASVVAEVTAALLSVLVPISNGRSLGGRQFLSLQAWYFTFPLTYTVLASVPAASSKGASQVTLTSCVSTTRLSNNGSGCFSGAGVGLNSPTL